MNQSKRIFIVGHSGAGKGVLAKALAEKLACQFIDADFSLAPSIGRHMHEIIGKQGEEKFYQCLSEILSYQLAQDNIVVATDDSIVCSEKNRQLLTRELTVYIKVSTSVQLARISTNRPLLAVNDYRGFLDKLHQERDAFYEQVASISISSDDGDIKTHVSNIIKVIEK